MLYDPLEDVLTPLTPSDAQGYCEIAFEVSAGPPALAKCDGRSVDLAVCLAALERSETSGDGSYDAGFQAFADADYSEAGHAFAAVAHTAGPVGPALFGLACALNAIEAHKTALPLARFVAETRAYTDPRAHALAGYLCFKLGKAKDARVHLAKAARLASKDPKYRQVQKFAQRVLLVQQFGNSSV